MANSSFQSRQVFLSIYSSNAVAFGHNDLWHPPTWSSHFMTLGLLCPLAIINYGDPLLKIASLCQDTDSLTTGLCCEHGQGDGVSGH